MDLNDIIESQPHYIYKIFPSTLPIREPLPNRLPVSELDEQSGFIHLSTADQVPNTLNLFFAEEPVVYVLRIAYSVIFEYIRWESPDGKRIAEGPENGLFPHLYNGLNLGRNEVESIAIWQNDEGWEVALKDANRWLVY
ncbi:hypothetical protein N7495_008412 [Penicillium taxi]|uniref:uncharacterized protein n=1 Tax=Penicillium taxi TaxID=168475 RepID=UPI002545294F|nr:uncharacterized protein N7495_008412 [Penicillium taxi]KAJ5888371.1 hypothetical protein N7495_008412 [Penicillium taxi]